MGLQVDYFEFAEGRTSVVPRAGSSAAGAAVLHRTSGHRTARHAVDGTPFRGETDGDRLYSAAPPT
jgi:hypothetical protein